MTERISAEEAERLREMLLKYDSERPPNIFDFSNPPKVPYSHQEFPKVVYNHESSRPEMTVQKKDLLGNVTNEIVAAKIATKTVNSVEELQKAISEGWDEKPPNFNEEVKDDEAADFSTEIAATPRRGRPKKKAVEV